MSNRTFLAFLGTGGYQPCTYKYEGKAETSKYIQIALLKIFCSDFDENDKIRIFVTKRARSVHWEPEDGSDGLKKEIDALGMKADVKAVDIPDGESEIKLWDIFQAVYDEIDEKTSIIFDMTHAFRSLPMFGMTVINYAHYLKNTTLEGIYYGAYEAIDNTTGAAPIFDLTPAFDLMAWTSAANSFTKYGITEELCKRIEWNPAQIESADTLANSIRTMEETLTYMRGRQIVEGQVFDDCKKQIKQYKTSESKKIPPLSKILSEVNKKICNFENKESRPSNLNFVRAVEWYLDHSMPAEALTMLKEGMAPYLLEKHSDMCERYMSQGNEREKRLRYNALLRLLNERLGSDKPDERSDCRKPVTVCFDWGKADDNAKYIVRSIVEKEPKLKFLVEKVKKCRDQIDHCGFRLKMNNKTSNKGGNEAEMEKALAVIKMPKKYIELLKEIMNKFQEEEE